MEAWTCSVIEALGLYGMLVGSCPWTEVNLVCSWGNTTQENPSVLLYCLMLSIRGKNNFWVEMLCVQPQVLFQHQHLHIYLPVSRSPHESPS